MNGLARGLKFQQHNGKGELLGEGEVRELLGEGGQGSVYLARWEGREMALKWYVEPFLKSVPDHKKNLAKVIKLGAPTPKFLWPQVIVTIQNRSEFGYLMNLRPKEYSSLNAYVSRKVRTSLRNALTACYQLADSFRTLHLKGYAYRDISRGNAFINVSNGDVLICDNDNVVPNNSLQTGVMGTGNFIAPEILKGNGAVPNGDSDLHSLAVLMFQILFLAHPLDGKRWANIRALDNLAQILLYRDDPLFVFDPENDSNRPVPGLQNNPLLFWKIYPQSLKDLFIQAFTVGLRSPAHRVRESQWTGCFLEEMDHLVYCGNCGNEHFVDVPPSPPSRTYNGSCWNCNRIVSLPLSLRVDRKRIFLNRDTVLHPHHISRSQETNLDRIVAQVRRHPTDQSIWGLTNHSDRNWVVEDASSSGQSEVPPGRSVTLSPGTRIQFGTGIYGYVEAS